MGKSSDLHDFVYSGTAAGKPSRRAPRSAADACDMLPRRNRALRPPHTTNREHYTSTGMWTQGLYARSAMALSIGQSLPICALYARSTSTQTVLTSTFCWSIKSPLRDGTKTRLRHHFCSEHHHEHHHFHQVAHWRFPWRLHFRAVVVLNLPLRHANKHVGRARAVMSRSWRRRPRIQGW